MKEEKLTKSPSIKVKAQYMKNLRFDLPSVKELEKMMQVVSEGKKPDIKIDIGVNFSQMEEDLNETILAIKMHGKNEEKTAFEFEVIYAGMFLIKDANEKQKEMICSINAPAFLFPFARRIVSDVMRDAGLPPLMIDPIDFGRLYFSKQNSKGNA